MTDTLIVIPSKRPAPLKTLESYQSKNFRIVLLSDPDIYENHLEHYFDSEITVERGVKGSIPQTMEVYRTAARLGYDYVFRLDDDIQPKFFVDYKKDYPNLDFAVAMARMCIAETKTSYAGFMNTSRTNWLGQEHGVFKRTGSLVHGGASIAKAVPPEEIIDPALPMYDDVYRTCAHRRRDGALGRVTWIGIDKRESLRNSVTDDSKSELAIKMILEKFPDLIKCDGVRQADGGLQVFPNFKFLGRPKQL